MKVHTHIGGSPCVVQLLPNWEAYIEDRGYVPNSTNHTTLEFVRGGQVRRRKCVPKEHAPTVIAHWMRRWKQGVMP